MPANIGIKLTLDDAQYARALKSASDATRKFAKTAESSVLSFSGLRKLLAGGLVYAAINKIVDETKQAQAAQGQLAAVLKSTGGAAGVTKEAAIELSKRMQDLTTVDNDVVLSAENILLTFTKIKSDAFEPATMAVLDLSTALGQDLNSTAIQVGKALNDPIKGLTALRRVGVSFTEQQEETIKSMVRLGDTAGAQKKILAELNKEFGGSAAARANTLEGAFNRISNAAGDIAKEIGNKVTPNLILFGNTLSDATREGGALRKIISSIGDIGSAVFGAMSLMVADLSDSFATAAYYIEYASSNFDDNAASVKAARQEMEKTNKELEDVAWRLGRIRKFEKGNVEIVLKNENIFEAPDPDRAAELINQGFKEILPKVDPIKIPIKPVISEDDIKKEADKKKKDLISEINNAITSTINESSGLISNIGNLYNTVIDGQIKALEQMKSSADMAVDYAKKQALLAAGIIEETQAQQEAKNVRALERQISKTNSLQQKRALQEELIQARKNKKKAEIEEAYQKKQHQIEIAYDILRAQLQRRQFERQKGFQIASVWINTAAAIVAASLAAFQMQSSFGNVYVAAGLAAAMAALLTASAGVQTDTIMRQKAPAYETGSLYVPRTGPAIVHEGETVFPKPLADEFRSFMRGGGAGGVTLNINAPVYDRVGFAKVLKEFFATTKIKLATGGVW